MKPTFLTKSNAGIHLSQSEFLVKSPSDIEKMLENHGFILIKGLPWERTDLQHYFSSLGSLVHNRQRHQDTFLELDGKMEAKEVLRGTGRMPLHRDGLMMNNNVKYIGIYCLDIDVNIGGRTYVSDAISAWKLVPQEIKNALKENGIEILPFDTTYYLKNEEKWYPFEGIVNYNENEMMNGGLSYHGGERRSYDIRIPKLSADISSQYFERIEAIFEDPEFTYYHDWQKGDLLLLNNFSTMHGRESYSGLRNIVQIQVSI